MNGPPNKDTAHIEHKEFQLFTHGSHGASGESPPAGDHLIS
jgi:hypothetical protein